MARGAWDPVASLLAAQANASRDPDETPTPYASSDFNPLRIPEVREAESNILPYDPAVLIAIAELGK